VIWIASIALPLFAAFLSLRAPLHLRAREVLYVAVAAPAAWIVVAPPELFQAVVPWLFMEAAFGLDPPRQILLFLTVSLWTVAGIYASTYLRDDARRGAFHFFFLLTMSGNLGLVMAEDVVSFYTFFAVMTFAAYGLVVHERTPAARRAGKVYVMMALIGEAFLLGCIFLAVDAAGTTSMAGIRAAVPASEHAPLIMAGAFIGFGVKAGALGLHMWLPLAHPVAPTPASAVLSGSMIKAGLLGWMNLLPLGVAAYNGWSTALIALGIVTAFYAVVFGLGQSDAKTNLAYSSISQMGLMTVGVGIGLAAPEAWPLVGTIVAVYALSHGLAKGALFLGVGVHRPVAGHPWRRGILLGGLVLAAAAVAGGPLTGGSIAKKALAGVAELGPERAVAVLDWLLPLASTATTLLLGRFLLLVYRQGPAEPRPDRHHPSGAWRAWLFLMAMVATALWLAVPYYAVEVDLPGLTPAEVWESLWPMLLGIALLLGGAVAMGKKGTWYSFPPGDILIPVERATGTLNRLWGRSGVGAPEALAINLEPHVRSLLRSRRFNRAMDRIESRLTGWTTAGFLVVLLILGFILIGNGG
jgi:formate hydrogenlyase subunit 3/multisubunit Na+/H+ antiporter MnhD subunit